MAKRGYKLQEFVAHSGNVNCLSIGKKACRLFLTGGEDNKVNLWSIGKPNSLTNLCGHTSPVESVAFDSAETLVLGGGSSGVLKLWDLEEAKMVRGLTGHRSNCTAVEFHPFGEFFASGSMDTNLKIWDIRKKGCIHTYKGHTRGIGTIRFTPDGRWVVSGGYDNIVKVWDLTAGKLLHDFKFHENHIRSIDFHPLEFLLATGSADRTVKFWDLETFELIGSTRPEATGVRAITFHPDGRTLFCGLDDSLKVYSWEPVICHDSVDMGWSTLRDLCINDGKVLGCSYYQNLVGVWVSDISLIEPYGANVVPTKKDVMQHGFNIQENCTSVKTGSGERSITSFSCPSPDYETKEIKNIYVDTAGGYPVSSQRVDSLSAPKVILPLDSPDTGNLMVKRHSSSARGSPEKSREQTIPKSFSVPDVANEENTEGKESYAPRRESITFSRTKPGMLLKPAHRRKPSSTKLDPDGFTSNAEMKPSYETKAGLDGSADPMLMKLHSHRRRLSSTTFDFEKLSVSSERKTHSTPKIDSDGPAETVIQTVPEPPKESSKGVPGKIEKKSSQTPKDENSNGSVNSSQGVEPVKIVNGVAVIPGRTRTLVERFERREKLNVAEEQTTSSPPEELPVTDKGSTILLESFEQKETLSSSGNELIDNPTNLSAAHGQTPTTDCGSERRESMIKSAEDHASGSPSLCLWPPRSKMPPSPINSGERREPPSDEVDQGASVYHSTVVLTRDKSLNSQAALERRERPSSKEGREAIPISGSERIESQNGEDLATSVSHNVVVLTRDKSSKSQAGAFERRERPSSKAGREDTIVPNVVLGRDRVPTSQVSSYERRRRINSKDDQSASIMSPNISLGRDKIPTKNSSGFVRRERPDSREDQPTKNSSRILPSRERMSPSLGSSTRRRERSSSPEDQAINRAMPVMEGTRGENGRFERRERRDTAMDDQEASMPLRTISVIDKMASSLMSEPQISGREADSADDKDAAEVLMESHEVFLSTLRSRLTKLQVIRHFFERNDMKGAINAMRKLPDHSVQADVIGILIEKMEILNLDLFSSLLPLLVGLLDSKIERHTSLSLEMLLKLVAVFGSVVFATVSAPPTVGVDLHAEQRRECCNQCFAQLQKIQKILPLLMRRGGVVARCAQELNLVLQQS